MTTKEISDLVSEIVDSIYSSGWNDAQEALEGGEKPRSFSIAHSFHN